LALEIAHELAGVARHELHAALRDLLERTREDVRPHLRRTAAPAPAPAPASHGRGHIPGLSPHEDRVDGLPEGCHEVLHVAAEVQPIQRSVLRGDESVETTGGAIGHGAHRSVLLVGGTRGPFPLY